MTIFAIISQLYAFFAVKGGVPSKLEQEGQHPLTGQRAANFRLLAYTSEPNAG